MHIETELDLQQKTKGLEKLLDLLFRMSFEKNNLYSLPNIGVDYSLASVPLTTLFAFYITKALGPMLPNFTPFTLFQTLSSNLKQFRGQDLSIRALSKALKVFLTDNHLSDAQISTSLAFLPLLRNMRLMYGNLKRNSFTLKVNNHYSLIDEHAPERYAGILLERIAERFGTELDLTNLQNRVVELGLELNINDKRRNLFILGSPFSGTDIISCDYANLVSLYINNKLFDYLLDNDSLQTGKSVLPFELPESRTGSIAYLEMLERLHNIAITLEREKVETLAMAYKDYIIELEDLPLINTDIVDEWMRQLTLISDLYHHVKNKVEQSPKHARVKILIFGDSVSAGMGIPSSHKRWVNRLQKLFEKEPYLVEIPNCSIPDTYVEGSEVRIARELKIHKPDIVLCTLGGNDANIQRDIMKIYRDLKKVVQTCLNDNIPAHRIFWSTGIPEVFKADEAYRVSFIGIFETLIEDYGIQAVPIDSKYLKASLMQADKLHLNEQAQPLLAKQAFNLLRKDARLVNEEKMAALLAGPKFEKKGAASQNPSVVLNITIDVADSDNEREDISLGAISDLSLSGQAKNSPPNYPASMRNLRIKVEPEMILQRANSFNETFFSSGANLLRPRPLRTQSNEALSADFIDDTVSKAHKP